MPEGQVKSHDDTQIEEHEPDANPLGDLIRDTVVLRVVMELLFALPAELM